MSENVELESVKKSLQRIREFDPKTLERKSDLGSAFELSAAIPPAMRLVELFKLLPIGTLDYFADRELAIIQASSDSIFKLFSTALEFDPTKEAEPNHRRMSLISSLQEAYQPNFSSLSPLISFAVARTANLVSLADEGRAIIQRIDDETKELYSQIEERGGDVEKILEEARKNLAEQGVSKEAHHFKTQADNHETQAKVWQNTTIKWAFVLGIYALLTLFMHRISWIAPANGIELVQVTLSKILIFGVIAYMLSLSAKNFLSNRHNEIINRHRVNALMSYRSIVEATNSPQASDIILQQAALAIYTFQDTGYVRTTEKNTNTITELLPRTTVPVSTT